MILNAHKGRNLAINLLKLNFISGETIEISPSVTAIVGANNSGKSTVLREAFQALSREPYHGINTDHTIVHGYELGPMESMFAFLEQSTAEHRAPGQFLEGSFTEETWRFPNGHIVLASQLTSQWMSNSGLGQAAPFFCMLLDASSRLHLANTTSSYNALREVPSNPMQKLYADRGLEAALSTLTTRAFGQPITVNRYGGSQISLHVGAPVNAEDSAPPTHEYLEELASLPLVDSQGDGFKAFIGMVLSVLAGSYPLVLIDEPEAFLHPPQARLLGQFLSEQHSNGGQVIVATHSEDVIAGLTAARGGQTSIVRLSRNSSSSSFAQLSSDSVQRLYADPLIRYYDMLNGLFSRGVVICEADSDCTYYRAVLEELDTKDGVDSALHLTHTGGKARIHVAVEAFHQTRVPVAAIVDIDLLQNKTDFDRLVTASGGNAADLARDRQVVVAAIEDRTQRKSVAAARAEIEEFFTAATGEVTSGLVGKVTDAMKGRSGWKDFKSQGRRMFSGDVLATYDRLDNALRTLGVFLVPVGELECFNRNFSAANKAQWLRSVLEAESYKTDTEARDFIRGVREFTSSQ